ncbi:putative hydrolase of the HAD superfamily [Solimonas aquatica]|uniref:Putative hydrolase of the HAD superfamily n=1 Tax=Solimonas aquatica TaxID=489703 RepID=A0A1H9GMR7_9GAMM|nr:GMP/IMP nucleotidase [Solimonas aquatica]SEQ51412.1 putative hydrolase of the HAD superfamily [Solimonas aquatica]
MEHLANAHLLNWADIDWVLLDMDGTLLDLSFDNFFWREHVPMRYAEKHGLALEDARAQLEPKFLAVQHTLPWYCTDHWSRETGLDLAALKQEVRGRIGVIPGAEEFLRAVRRSGRRIWLATNAHRDSWRLKLEVTGIGQYFEQVICSHDYGHPKEDQRFWQALQAQQPFDPARTLFVDDSMPVLSAAEAYGIAQVIGIRKPDRNLPERPLPAMRSVATIAELTAGVPA